MALVHDEYGHFEGVVTNADILEAIVGASARAGSTSEQPVQRADGSWLIAGSMPADEMADKLSLSLPADRSYHTVAGFVLLSSASFPRSASTSTRSAGASRWSTSTAAASTS